MTEFQSAIVKEFGHKNKYSMWNHASTRTPQELREIRKLQELNKKRYANMKFIKI